MPAAETPEDFLNRLVPRTRPAPQHEFAVLAADLEGLEWLSLAARQRGWSVAFGPRPPAAFRPGQWRAIATLTEDLCLAGLTETAEDIVGQFPPGF